MGSLKRPLPQIIRTTAHQLTAATALLFALCIARALFCASAPDVLSGRAGRDIDVLMMSLAVPFLIGAYWCLKHFGAPRAALAASLPAMYLLGGVAMMRTQLIVFHVGRDYPLMDDQLAAIDQILQFDWPTYVGWFAARPFLNGLLAQVYHSLWWQPTFLAMLLIIMGDSRNYVRLQVAIPVSFALTCVVAIFLPTLGAFEHFGMASAAQPDAEFVFTNGSTAPLRWIRQANLPAVLPPFPELRVLTFPSWHAAAAMVLILVAWHVEGVRGVRWIALTLNVVMVMATPVHGSHYLIDVIVGALIGVAAWLIGSWASVTLPNFLRQVNARLQGRASREHADAAVPLNVLLR